MAVCALSLPLRSPWEDNYSRAVCDRPLSHPAEIRNTWRLIADFSAIKRAPTGKGFNRRAFGLRDRLVKLVALPISAAA